MILNENSATPIYVQIAEMIEDLILKDTLKKDTQVYSTNQLAQLYNINPATARKGLNILVDEKIIYKKRGIGMFVSPDAKEYIQTKRKNNFCEDFVSKLLKEGTALGLSKDEIIQMIKNYEIKE